MILLKSSFEGKKDYIFYISLISPSRGKPSVSFLKFLNLHLNQVKGGGKQLTGQKGAKYRQPQKGATLNMILLKTDYILHFS